MANYNNNIFPNTYPSGYGVPYQPQTRVNQYAFVNGIEGAKSYQVSPNQTMLLMDSDNPICYMKQANNVGQATLRYFKLEELDEDKTREFLKTIPKETNVEYALKSDIDTMNKKLEELTKLLKKQLKGE